MATIQLDAALLWLVAAALVSGVMAYLGAMVGLVLGQFRLPLLVVALSSAPAAAASNLAISSLGAGTGALTHAREGRVELRLLLSIGLPSAIAAYISSRSVAKVEGWWIEAVIGATLLISAVPLGRKAVAIHKSSAAAKPEPAASDSPPTASAPSPSASGPERTAPADTGPDSSGNRPRLRGKLLALEVVIGVVLGALSGVVGLLLGTLRLPAMLRLGVSAPKAAGTNMAIGFFTGVAGALGAIGSGRVSLLAFATVGGATFLGAYLGAKQTKSLPTARHFALIASVLVAVGIWLISKAVLNQ